MSGVPEKTSCVSGSRRQFLGRAGGLVAASAWGGAAAGRCHAAENNTIKLALVGCGGRGTGAVGNALSTNGGPVKLHAMADLFENRLQGSFDRLSARFPEKIDVPPERRFLGFDAYKKAIDSLGPGDVILLTTHAAFRPVHFEYAVAKGVNVFMEKSFAVDAPATRRLLQSAEESQRKGLKVGVGFMWRHSKARQETIARIHDGAIGDLHSLRIYRVHGPVHCPKLPEGANETVFQLQNSPRFNWTCSGFLIDWHCHNIDVACWAKDAWPVSAQGMGGRCYAEAGNLFDHYTVEYTFDDGTKLFVFSRHMANCWQTYADYAHGTKGSAVLMSSLSKPNARIYKSQKMVDEHLAWRFDEGEANPYDVEWQVLLDSIRNDTPHNESRRAVDANFTALMGRMATHTGALVTWEEATKSKFQYVDDIDHLTFDSPPPILANPDGTYEAPQPGISREI